MYTKCYLTLNEVSKVGKDTVNYLTPDTLVSFAGVNLLSYSSKNALLMLRGGKKMQVYNILSEWSVLIMKPLFPLMEIKKRTVYLGPSEMRLGEENIFRHTALKYTSYSRSDSICYATSNLKNK